MAAGLPASFNDELCLFAFCLFAFCLFAFCLFALCKSRGRQLARLLRQFPGGFTPRNQLTVAVVSQTTPVSLHSGIGTVA